jgi:hypothetical protein
MVHNYRETIQRKLYLPYTSARGSKIYTSMALFIYLSKMLGFFKKGANIAKFNAVKGITGIA